MLLKKGKILQGRYRIEAFLGRGGMAEVYKVWDRKRAVYLAMKVLREDLAEDRVFLRRFQREAQTLARLQHPNIVRFYGLTMTEAGAVLLMEYVEGETLRRRLGRVRALSGVLSLVLVLGLALIGCGGQGLRATGGLALTETTSVPAATPSGTWTPTVTRTATLTPTFTPTWIPTPTLFIGPVRMGTPVPTPSEVITVENAVSLKPLAIWQGAERGRIFFASSNELLILDISCLETDEEALPSRCLQMKVILRRVSIKEGKEVNRVLLEGVPPEGTWAFSSYAQKLALATCAQEKKEKRFVQVDWFTFRKCIQFSLRVWDANTGELIQEWRKSIKTENFHFPIAFAQNTSFVAVGILDRLYLWDVATGRQKGVSQHKGVLSVAFLPKGQVVASGACPELWQGVASIWCPYGQIQLWHLKNKTKERIEICRNEIMAGLSCEPRYIIFSPDAHYLAAILGSANMGKGVEIWSLEGSHSVLEESADVNTITFTQDSKMLVLGFENGTIEFWDIQTGDRVLTLQGHRDAVTQILVSPDGKILASRSADGTIRLWGVLTP